VQVGHGIRKPDYDAADKSQRLLLGVPAPALKHSFAQHLIRGEKVMDPDAGVRNRVKVREICEAAGLVSPARPMSVSLEWGVAHFSQGGGNASPFGMWNPGGLVPLDKRSFECPIRFFIDSKQNERHENWVIAVFCHFLRGNRWKILLQNSAKRESLPSCRFRPR